MDTQTTPGDRAAVLISLVMSAAAFSSIAVWPAWRFEVNVLGSPLGIDLSGRWLVVMLVVAAAAVGTDGLVRSSRELQAIEMRFTATFWVLPGLVAFAAATAVPALFGSVGVWLSSLVLIGTLFGSVILAEYGTASLDNPHYRNARLVLNVACYCAAFVLYAFFYGLQARSLLSATAIAAVTFLLALELLRSTEEQLETTGIYAAVIALTAGELTWALNAWGLSPLTGGALLLVVFYTLGGISQQHLAGRLTRRVLAEFLVIAVLSATAVWWSSPWLAH